MNKVTSNGMKICILEPQDYSPEAIAIYKSLGEVSLGPTQKQSADILVIRLAHKFTKGVLDEYKNLKIIACPTTGLDHIDLKECERRGIKVISLNGETAFLETVTATAELAWGLVLSLVRKIPFAHRDIIQNLNWNRDAWKGFELKDKKLGILGFGRLGKIVAEYGTAFGMEVMAHDSYVAFETISAHNVTPVSFDELFKNADVLSIHIPLNESTAKLIGADELKLMKSTAYLINTSRGEVIDEAALVAALQSGKIAGAGLDVMANEHANGKFLEHNPLVEYAKTYSNLLITPHLGGATYDAMSKTEIFIANKVREAISDKT